MEDNILKKIAFVINYFYPDYASTGQLMTDLCFALKGDFKITVIAALPEQWKKESSHTKLKLFNVNYLDGIKIIRIKLPTVNKSVKLSRIKYVISYFILASVALILEKKVSIIYTISTPPILGGLIGTIGKIIKKARHVYNIQDFNPEQAVAVSYIKNKLTFKIAQRIDNYNCKYADKVVVVGNDMVETLEKRFNKKSVPDHIVINNWTDENKIVPLNKNDKYVSKFLTENHLENKFIVMYSGNLGLYYDLENLIKVTKNFASDNNIAFVFIGEGAVKKQMQSFVTLHNITNVLFLNFQPKEYLKYSLNIADVHLVVNQKGIKGVSVPSKIYGVMAAGKPILGILERGSEAEQLISISKCGKVAEPRDYSNIVDLINYFYNLSNKERETMGLNGRAYLDKYLKKDISIEKYRRVLLEL